MKGQVIEMMTVRDVMTRPVMTVGRDVPLKDVARTLIDNGVSGLPVIAEDGAVVGVVSEADFLMKEQGAESVRHRRLAQLIGESAETRAQLVKLAARTAGDAMTSPAVTIAPSSSIRDAAATMTRQRVNRLPVVEEGRLVGIVTRADLVRAYLRTDEELIRTIREDVLLRILWLDPAQFDVSVQNGEATVRGHVDRRSSATIIEETVAMVPGIVSAKVDISWSIDDRDLRPAAADLVSRYGPR